MNAKELYTTESGNPCLKPSFVCYADILGFKDLTIEYSKKVNGLVDLLERLLNCLSEAYAELRRKGTAYDIKLFSTKVFTDNIVVGCPALFPREETSLADILDTFSAHQAYLASCGFFLRGGIAYGHHYMNEDIVFGEAFLEAYKLEEKGDKPMLVLSPSAVDQIKKYSDLYLPGHSPWRDDLIQYCGDHIFLNYINTAFYHFPEAPINFESICKHKKAIEAGLNKNMVEQSTRAKYEWVARYHNYVCREFMASHPVPSDPNADEVYGAACLDAQKLTNYLIDIEPIEGEFSPINLGRGEISPDNPSPLG